MPKMIAGIGGQIFIRKDYWIDYSRHQPSRGSGMSKKTTKDELILRMIDHRLTGGGIWRLDTCNAVSRTRRYRTGLYLDGGRPIFSIEAQPSMDDWIEGSYRKIGFDEAKALINKYWNNRI